MNPRRFLALALTLATLAALPVASGSAPAPASSSGADGLTRLRAGNDRYAADRSEAPRRAERDRRAVAEGQRPFAVVVACSDSRVSPELVFDQGLGDLFVVRNAGHVVDDVALGSIEFAVGKLGARTIFVMGHERCGAVQAALEHAEVPGSIGHVLAAIEPAVGGPEKATPEALDRAAQRQVAAVVERLRTASPLLSPLVRDGSLAVAGGVYDLDTGRVKVSAPEPAR